ncbi:metal ABC transporter solute-binding protein, Zn/Mn family [Dongia rigui]|uniref:Zinc ABC transporter substrate-binding protein n=1 Tax=Dongia rigui TaxID=940149 RepID=A0ABU5DSD1_9PROT|nr:zinc ABC transporter substrate-binding protein [Dongia rigui]MDY0870323.1 zinc ABC transporter substrate-binding protein [Dongia rigui]
MTGLAAGLLLSVPAIAEADGKLPVVATFSILGDLTQHIGGDAIALTTLVGPDSDAHAFEPTAESQRAVAGARVLVANGLGLEPWLDRLIDASTFKGELVEATTGIEPLASTEAEEPAAEGEGAHDHDHGGPDPHAFQDPKLVLTYIDNIAAGLAKAAPESAGAFRKNAEDLKARFRALDTELSASLGSLPSENKRILTSHDAFQYFGRAYGIDFVAVQGMSTEAEPSAQDLKNIVEQIKGGDIKAIFIENMNDPRFVESLAADTGAVVGGDLHSDALSAPGGPAADLLSLYRYNAAELLKVLK